MKLPDDPAALLKAKRGCKQPGLVVLERIAEVLDGHGTILAHSEIPWCSVTFSGFRLLATVRFSGLDAGIYGEAFLEALSEYEFKIPGLLLADAGTTWVNRQAHPIELTAQVSLLLLEDPAR